MPARRYLVPLLLLALLPACSEDPEPILPPTPPSLAPSLTPPSLAPTSAPPSPPAAATAAPTAPAAPPPLTRAPDPSPAPIRPAPSSAPTAAAPPFTADTRPDTSEPSGAPLGPVSIRAARQEGFDRVVIELTSRAPGTPGWRVSYDPDPRADGSGDPVVLPGDATLEVRLTNMGTPPDTGGPTQIQTDDASGLRVVTAIERGPLFEGQFQVFLGVDRTRPFRVFHLENPDRVVIDVRHQ